MGLGGLCPAATLLCCRCLDVGPVLGPLCVGGSPLGRRGCQGQGEQLPFPHPKTFPERARVTACPLAPTAELSGSQLSGPCPGIFLDPARTILLSYSSDVCVCQNIHSIGTDFPGEVLSGSPQLCLPAPSPKSPRANPPILHPDNLSPPRAGPFAPQWGWQIRAIGAPSHQPLCSHRSSQPFDHASPLTLIESRLLRVSVLQGRVLLCSPGRVTP